MTPRRVVVTGMSGVTSLGQTWEEIEKNLKEGASGVQRMPDWERYSDLLTRLGAPVLNFALPPHYTRKTTRTMGRIAQMAVRSSEVALEDAGLAGDPFLKSGRVGVAYGSSTGSTDAIRDFGNMLTSGESGNINATTYIRMMGHTAAVNIGVYFGLQGRVIPTSSACTSGSQGIGYAYEAIRFGLQDAMVAGGGEELCVSEAAVFDTLYATSTRNDAPKTTPAPFDKTRDGLVIGEGACSLVIEERDRAIARGAKIYAEIVGFASNSDGDHVTHPNTTTMERVMRMALDAAGIPPDAVKYVNAHGTATEHGDIAESQATFRIFGQKAPVSSLKGHFGHTLGACGALESWATIQMMRNGWFAPTRNLVSVDERCGDLDYLQGDGRKLDIDIAMNNNFAFGGINTSLIFARSQ
ncbi:MAG: beta-ketoacyl-ACP synthase [Steroidobacteraceae bacterium]|nr:beta-ketoacyl-ACP synthase [Steroidobacteraceae bacterium]